MSILVGTARGMLVAPREDRRSHDITGTRPGLEQACVDRRASSRTRDRRRQRKRPPRCWPGARPPPRVRHPRRPDTEISVTSGRGWGGLPGKRTRRLRVHEVDHGRADRVWPADQRASVGATGSPETWLTRQRPGSARQRATASNVSASTAPRSRGITRRERTTTRRERTTTRRESGGRRSFTLLFASFLSWRARHGGASRLLSGFSPIPGP